MTNVKFKQGNSLSLPTSAQANELLFTLDTGKIYKGNGTGVALTPFSDVLFGFANLADLQAKVSNGINGKLYLTDENKLYRFRNGAYELVASSSDITSFEASKVTFNNTGTTLTGTNVQAVGVELDGKVEANKADITTLKSDSGKIKANASDTTLGYLSDKIDGSTVQIVDNKLVVKNIDGVTVGVADINRLTGITANIQGQLDALDNKINASTSGVTYGGEVATHADLDNITNPTNGTLIVVLADENHEGARGAYIYNGTTLEWDYFGTFDMAETFVSLTDTPNNYVVDKYLMSDGSAIVYGDLDYNKLVGKPTSTVTQIDQAVADMHTHANKEALDKFAENTEGKPTYNGQLLGEPLVWEDWDI